MVITGLGIVWFAVRFGKRRTCTFARVAEQLGLSFTQAIPLSSYANRPSEAWITAPIFRTGGTIVNMMSGRVDNREIRIFEYPDPNWSGESPHSFTAAAFFQTPALPRFTLRPRSIKDKILSRFKPRGLLFKMHSRFSKRYALIAQDNTAIRQLFHENILGVFETISPPWSIECVGEWAVIYHQPSFSVIGEQSGRVGAEELPQFIDDTKKVVQLLRTPQTTVQII